MEDLQKAKSEAKKILFKMKEIQAKASSDMNWSSIVSKVVIKNKYESDMKILKKALQERINIIKTEEVKKPEAITPKSDTTSAMEQVKKFKKVKTNDLYI